MNLVPSQFKKWHARDADLFLFLLLLRGVRKILYRFIQRKRISRASVR